MHEAGIQLDHMLPLMKDRAYELYRGGAEIYILYGNPENPQRAEQVLVETENEIFGYDGNPFHQWYSPGSLQIPFP